MNIGVIIQGSTITISDWSPFKHHCWINRAWETFCFIKREVMHRTYRTTVTISWISRSTFTWKISWSIGTNCINMTSPIICWTFINIFLIIYSFFRNWSSWWRKKKKKLPSQILFKGLQSKWSTPPQVLETLPSKPSKHLPLIVSERSNIVRFHSAFPSIIYGQKARKKIKYSIEFLLNKWTRENLFHN